MTTAAELQQLVQSIKAAKRLGQMYDEPEGSRYIVISDTLVTQICNLLDRAAAELLYDQPQADAPHASAQCTCLACRKVSY